MPTFCHDSLEKIGSQIFRAIGVAQQGADWIAHLLVRANLRGHDSHGVIRIPQYIESWRNGEIDAKAEPVVVQDGPATARVDGKFGFGQIVARLGMEVAMQKAEAIGVSAVGISNCNHIGRLADYAEMAMERNMLALISVNSAAGQRMAPWGGRAPRLSTNPIAFACPAGEAVPVSFDFATTVVAEGKVRVKRNRGETIPSDWVLDAGGNPSTDPNQLYGTPPGSILPAGGHKGYCLAVMIDVLAGILTRAGYSRPNPGPILNGVFIVVVDIARFVAPETFKAEVDDLIGYLRSSPTIPRVNKILTPGEPELLTEAERQKAGVFVEDQTWGQILKILKEFKLEVPAAP